MPRDPSPLPYLVHTNREFGLMLKGLKPLARFSEYEGYFPDLMLRYFRMFDRHVESGRFVRRDEIIDDHKGRQHYVYFALKDEEWRIQAMIDLMARPGRWSPEMIREEGELLGYTPEQNDIWQSFLRTLGD